ncbi:MAG: RsmB/NOP family class I SAM-dependent RNA methyltransferase [Desulfohalobiaceae bacterium]|nr:RsmB/NOP family class I SAM-dependent RNA methyltransferase [Desulfohalobiaceae bacterium]
MEQLLEEEGYALERPPFDDRARVAVSGPSSLGSSIAAFSGLLYIQDLTSMLPPLVLAPQEGEVVLDLCAAPGGKSGILSRLVGASGAVVANEPGGKRLGVLRNNLHLLECFNTVTTSYSGERFPESGPFYRILLDAPCSGWGTAEKNPRVTTMWPKERTGSLVELQRSLLRRGFELLSPGGRLVYSTCTTHDRENEEQIEWAARELGAEVEPLSPVEGFGNEADASGCLRVHGAEHGGQSFFLARLRKPGDSGEEGVHKAKEGDVSGNAPEEAGKWFADLGLDARNLPPGRLERTESGIYFAPSRVAEVLPGGSSWRGRYIGSQHRKGVRLTSRLRTLLPPPETTGGLDLGDAADIRHLIAGQSYSVASEGRFLGLYWRGLPLALLAVKKGRCLFAEKV